MTNGKGKTQVKLIAFIDDCSRVLCHGQFFFADNIANLITAFQTAIYKRGIPEQLYVDNGSNYASIEISNICTRIGTLLCHTPLPQRQATTLSQRRHQLTHHLVRRTQATGTRRHADIHS